MSRSRTLPLAALVGVTAVWGVTFVQVQDALELYPLFAFLAVRFAISSLALLPFAWRSVRTLPREGLVAGVGVGLLLAAAYGFQTAGLELTTVSSTGELETSSSCRSAPTVCRRGTRADGALIRWDGS